MKLFANIQERYLCYNNKVNNRNTKIEGWEGTGIHIFLLKLTRQHHQSFIPHMTYLSRAGKLNQIGESSD